jgi:hypothetical protein
MILFYLIALVPIMVGGLLWVKYNEINIWEWVSGSVVALMVALMFNLFAIHGMTDDIETWSGQAVRVIYYPEWVEKWIESHYETYACGTDSKGNTEYCSRTYYTTEYDTHSQHWTVVVDFGSLVDEWYINVDTFNQIKKEFGGKVVYGPPQGFDHGGEFIKGDRNTYVTENTTGFVRPVTTLKSFKNKIKAAPSVFSFSKVPTNITVFPWPKNDGNVWTSQRVLGNATKVIPTLEWDRLNCLLGPQKKINLIIVGFDSNDSMLGQYQQAAWIGGKKNDFVISYGGKPEAPAWCHVFGWTESELVKRNVEAYVMEHGVSMDLLPFIREEVLKNYKIKDWTKFDYIKIEPKPSYYAWFAICLIFIEGVLYVFFFMNDLDKEGYYSWRN